MSKHNPWVNQLSGINSDLEQNTNMLFLEKSYYVAFIQQLRLKEIKDESNYVLSYQDGKNWSVSLEDVAVAMQNMQNSEELKSQEMLSILKFVINKLDRNKSVPQFVRTYMCKDAVTRVVLERFKEETGGLYTNLTELSYKISDNIDEANEIFNSMRFCDPAMGSGSFLVTLLNEMIAIKSQLGILADKNGNPLFQYKVVADNENGLLVFDRKNLKPYRFTISDPESRRIQETLMYEKRTIIEKCLYGVDSEPLSVVISKLRLWVELLKHICWDGNPIQSWPIFEGNLRCGDSLVHRFSVHEDLKNIFKRIGHSVIDYKKWAENYKYAKTKEEKNISLQLITQIKRRLHSEIASNDRNNKELLKWQKELAEIKAPGLFELDDSDVKVLNTKQIEVQSMIDKYKQKIEDIENNSMYVHAIEWRYEFPDLLNEYGDFIGFDIIIGIPPDMQNQIIAESIEVYKQGYYQSFKRTGDISCLFYELGYTLLKPEYFLCYVTSNRWMKSISDDKMRQNIMHESNPLSMIGFNKTERIGMALPEQGITLIQKTRNQHRMMTCRIKEDFDPHLVDLEDYIIQNAELSIEESNETTTSPSMTLLSEIEKRIKTKIEQIGTPLVSWDIQMYSGIRTGCDEAFVIDGKMKDEFIRADYKNTEIIKPLLLGDSIKCYKLETSDLWLICIPWHFPLLYDKSIKTASEKSEARFRQQYPVIYRHLLKHKERLLNRNTQDVGLVFEWYAIQHFGTSNEWDDFTQPKIVWKRETKSPNFCLDYSGCAIMDSTCFITGQHLKYLLGALNSKLGRYMLLDSPRLSNGDIHINILTLKAMNIPIPNIKIESEVISLVNKRTSDGYRNDYDDLDGKINQYMYDMYGLDTDEREYIELKIEN